MLLQLSPLGAQIASLRTAPAASTAACGMLSNALHALIAAILARIFGRLEQILLLWQTGNLPTPLDRRTQPNSTPERRTDQPCPPLSYTPGVRTAVASASQAQRRPAPIRESGQTASGPRRHSQHPQAAPAVIQAPNPSPQIATPAPAQQPRAPPHQHPHLHQV